MSGIPPNQCYICYQTYNNERIPLILTTCGHTYCKECLLLIINRDSKEIICPECKQITLSSDNEFSNLPKNRTLLNLIIYNEQIAYKEKLHKQIQEAKNKEKNLDKNSENKIRMLKLFEKYDEVINKLEETYKLILNEHPYLNEISEVLIMKEIDEVLDNFVEVVNQHRINLQKKVKAEFEKANLIKDFSKSISCLRNKLDSYAKKYNGSNNGNIDIALINEEADKVYEFDCKVINSNNIIDKVDIDSIKFRSHNNLINCFNNQHNNIESIENINYCNTEINININNSSNLDFVMMNSDLNKTEIISNKKNFINNDNYNYNEKENLMINENQLKYQEEQNTEEKLLLHKKTNNNISNKDLETLNLNEELESNENNEKEGSQKQETIINTNKIICPHNSSKNFTKNEIQNENNSKNEIQNEITDGELENLENEIKYSELYYLTLKNFTKEIYNPCKFFYTNKFQLEKLCNDLKKMLFKACDFDENIVKFSLHDLNTFDEKKIIKEIQDCCAQSNNQKLKFIFTHFRLNPNFIYSDVLNQIANQNSNSAAEQHSSSNSNSNSNSVNANIQSGLNFNYSSGNQFAANNQSNFSSLNIMDPFIARRNLNNSSAANRNIGNRYYSNLLNNSNVKDKVFNLFSYLKSFKDKVELSDFAKFLIEEFDYIPLKIESEGNFDLKLVKEFDWKIQLGLI